VTAGWLARRWRATAWVWRLVLVALVAGLAVINAAGVYAQLVAAHVEQHGKATAAVETQEATLAARIHMASHNVADLDRRLSQIDTAIEEKAKRGKTSATLPRSKANAKPVRRLWMSESGKPVLWPPCKPSVRRWLPSGVKWTRKSHRSGRRRDLWRCDQEIAIRWLIALMVLCCDPLAIALAAAASVRRSTTV
jgi:hypothetical protein